MRIRTTSEDFFFLWALNLSNDDVLFAWTGMDFGGLAPVVQTRYPLDESLSSG